MAVAAGIGVGLPHRFVAGAGTSGAVLNWAAGMILAWGLFATIWLPYVDSRRSYRSVAESLAAALPPGTCVAARNLGEPQRALLEYFAGIVTVRDDAPGAKRCAALLLQVGRGE